MSADLFAEFGASQPQRSGPGKQDGVPATAQGVLLPDFHSPQQDPWQTRPTVTANADMPLWKKDSDGVNVLFDASETGGEEDESGDFEVVHAEESMTDAMRPPNLTGRGVFETWTNEENQANRTLIDEDADWGDFEDDPGDLDQQAITSKATPPGKATSSSTNVEDDATDEWDTFEDGKDDLIDHELTGAVEGPSLSVQGQHKPEAGQAVRKFKASGPVARPINVPPPAILLQMLPGIFLQLRNLGNGSNFSPIETAKDIIRVYVVACRLVAGRSLRWKRDTILAQSTKIGPAASGKSGGMKLTTVDRSEGIKEEQEASEAIDAWGRNTRIFNSILAKANTRRNILALSLTLLPRVDRRPGVLNAAYACALCGIRRDERLPTIDVDVSDTFGEFWFEYWGHKDCLDFWETYKGYLHRR